MVDSYWQHKLMKRREVYSILATLLQIPLEDCHIGMLDDEQCQSVLDKWNEFVPEDLRNAFIKPNIEME